MGTKAIASEVGLGAGASAAATFWTADTAINTTTMAKNSLIFNASIIEKRFVCKEEEAKIEYVEIKNGNCLLVLGKYLE